MKKLSEMMLAVGGDLLTAVDCVEEMQAHLNLVRTAWNIAVLPPAGRDAEIKAFIEVQRPHAPSAEALAGLEDEIRRVVGRKDKLFPEERRPVEYAQVLHKGGDDYVIRAYFVS